MYIRLLVLRAGDAGEGIDVTEAYVNRWPMVLAVS